MKIIDWLVLQLAKLAIWVRYRVTIKGIDKVKQNGRAGILFLPNHPAYMDPVILYTYLKKDFGPHGFADSKQLERPVVGYFAKRWGVRGIPIMSEHGSAAREAIHKAVMDSISDLKNGRNLILWPGGTLKKSRYENLGANSAVETILSHHPKVRVVLIKTTGLWGSEFSWGRGTEPKVSDVLKRSIYRIPANLFFFMPRRKVTIELYEPDDFPRASDRSKINRYIEDYYNAEPEENTYVPYYLFGKEKVHTLPEPKTAKAKGDVSDVPGSTKKIISEHLTELTGIRDIKPDDHLARDLQMDSLMRVDVQMWLESEFGIAQVDADILQTVSDLMLAANGQLIMEGPTQLKPVPKNWFKKSSHDRLSIPKSENIAELFLKRAKEEPGRVILADQNRGTMTYRQIVTSLLVLQRYIQNLEGQNVGIMLPASVAANITYLAVMFSSKVPVMVNWTVGSANLERTMDLADVKKILTSRQLTVRLDKQGLMSEGIEEKCVYLEDFAEKITFSQKLTAALKSYVSWGRLRNAEIAETAAVLFTSGSETVPKGVPLTHQNLLSNLRDGLEAMRYYEDDKLIGFLPPFHSFGLTATMLVSLIGKAQVVYYPNPVESKTLAGIIEAYKVSVFMGTPTFLHGIAKAADEGQLDSLRSGFTGAEKCSENVYSLLSEKAKNAQVLEGYGVTECSPIIAVNDENDPRAFTVGKILPSYDFLLLHPETGEVVDLPGEGVLVVKGPSVFSGYIGNPKDPFRQINQQKWYDTGDILSLDSDGIFTFKGRLKRFVKIAGEMISLAAIEHVLAKEFGDPDCDCQEIAVEAAGSESRPELTLFTILDLSREKVNQAIKKHGLSGLHNIREVIKVEQIPTLGTGKTDYRTLKSDLEQRRQEGDSKGNQ